MNPIVGYIPARCEHPSPGFVKLAPPGEDGVLSPDQKYFHKSTTPTNRGRNGGRPWRITSHPWIRNPSMHLQLQQTGNRNGGPPGNTATQSEQTSIRASWSQHYPGRIRSHLGITNPSIHLQFQQTGYEKSDPPGRYRIARCGNPNPTVRSPIGLGL